MKQLENQFQTNANGTGVQTFSLVKRGVTPQGKVVCMYQRTKLDGLLFGYEVFIPTIKKAGTYPLPGDKTITYAEDFEEYAGASRFGRSAWFCNSLETAQARFDLLTKEIVEIEDASDEPTVLVAKSSGRPKAVRPAFVLPDAEFSVKELAEQNKTEYPYAFIFVKEQIAAGKIKLTRKERRATRGPETQLYKKVVDSGS